MTSNPTIDSGQTASLSGGSLGVVRPTRRRHGLRYQRLIGRALRERWDIPRELKELSISRTKETLADPAAHPRSIAQSTRNLISAGQLNLSTIDAAVKLRLLEMRDDAANPEEDQPGEKTSLADFLKILNALGLLKDYEYAMKICGLNPSPGGNDVLIIPDNGRASPSEFEAARDRIIQEEVDAEIAAEYESEKAARMSQDEPREPSRPTSRPGSHASYDA